MYFFARILRCFFLAMVSIAVALHSIKAQNYVGIGAGQSQQVTKAQKYRNKLDRRIIISPFVGIGWIPGTTGLDAIGDRTNLWPPFNPLIHGGFGLYYPMPFYKRLLANAEWGGYISARQHYVFSNNALSVGAKFLLRDHRKKLNPYVGAGMALPVFFFFQEAHNQEFIPENDSIIKFGEALKFEKRIPEKNILFGPAISPYLNVGIEYRLDRKYSFFIQGNYTPVFSSQNRVKSDFPAHNGPLNYLSGRGGMNIQLMKPKPPYVDTAMIPIPDPILALNPIDEYQRQRMLVLEGNFEVLLREGMKHNVRLEVGAHDLIIDEEIKDPCRVVCFLYDTEGNVVARAESTPEGRVVFTDLDKGIYDVSFILDGPCQSADFTYRFPDPTVQPLLQYNDDHTVSDSVIYHIIGQVYVSDTANLAFVYKASPLFLAANEKAALNTNFDIATLLCDTNHKAVARFEPKRNEKFMFHKLLHRNFEVIYKTPDEDMVSKLEYTYFDQYKYPVRKINYVHIKDSLTRVNITEEDKFYEKLRFNLRGKILKTDSATKMNHITLYLVNENRKIVAVKKPDANGSFLFKNLKSKINYQVYYELDKPEGYVKFNTKPEELVPLPKANLDDVDVIGRRKRLVPDLAPPAESGQVYSYNVQGNIINPKGFGIQVGAFENISNVDLLCKKLIKEGFKDICIQVGMTEHMNKNFEFTRNFKLHKVFVGEYDRERAAHRTMHKLEYMGYDAYLIAYDKTISKNNK